MEEKPHLDQQVLDATVTASMEELVAELNIRYNKQGYYFQFNFQPNHVISSNRGWGENDYIFVKEVWDRFAIVINSSAFSSQSFPSQVTGTVVADHEMGLTTLGNGAHREYVMVPTNSDPHSLPPVAYSQPSMSANLTIQQTTAPSPYQAAYAQTTNYRDRKY